MMRHADMPAPRSCKQYRTEGCVFGEVPHDQCSVDIPKTQEQENALTPYLKPSGESVLEAMKRTDPREPQETRQEWYGLSHLREIIDSRTIGGGDIAVLEDAYIALSSSPREPQKDETPQCGELPPMGTRQERCELQAGHPGNHMAFGGAQIVASWPKREPHAALIAELKKLAATWREAAEQYRREAAHDRARRSVGLALPKEEHASRFILCADELERALKGA